MKLRTVMLWAAIVLLTVLPLWFATAPVSAPGEPALAMFGGADERAQQAIAIIAPTYRPWFSPVFAPASSEIASLLFALQAAAGAGVIGFWLGMSVARQRAERGVGASAQSPQSCTQDRHAD